MTNQKQSAPSRREFNEPVAANSTLTAMPVMKTTLCLIVVAVLGSGAAAQSKVGTLKVTYSETKGIGAEQDVMRRDPSDIIKVDDLYYVWYSKGKISPGYDATVWYATSKDGHKWTEKDMALAKGKPGSWEGASVFTPNILAAEGRLPSGSVYAER